MHRLSFVTVMPHHVTRQDQLTRWYDHIYISPHLDDAVLSCGGAIAHVVDAGQRVLIVNVCSGTPSFDEPFSAFAQQQHTYWNLDAMQAMAARLQEDQAALNCLDTDSYNLGLLDAIYRCPDAYTSDMTLFGDVSLADLLESTLVGIMRPLVQRFPEATLYAPLGVGEHVDHQVAYTVAAQLIREGVRALFYEDVPYACADGALPRRLQRLGGENAFVAQTVNIDATLDRKIDAIMCYTSQLNILFGGPTLVVQTVAACAQQASPDQRIFCERLWRSAVAPSQEPKH